MNVVQLGRIALCGGIMAVSVALAAAVLGGEVFVGAGVALRGYDPVAYFTDNRAVLGLSAHRGEYQGAVFHFASAENRAAFLANPVKFVPQYGGYCAYGAAKGYKAATDPEAFTIVDGKLYLNYDLDVQDRWRKDIPGYIRKADRNWPEVRLLSKIYE